MGQELQWLRGYHFWIDFIISFLTLVLESFNTVEPLYNEFVGITNNFLQPGQNYNKMHGTEPRFNEIVMITNTIQKRKRKYTSI